MVSRGVFTSEESVRMATEFVMTIKTVEIPVDGLCLAPPARNDRRLGAETVLLHLAPERDGADLEGLCSLAPIPAKSLERALDHGSLLCLKIETVVSGTLARLL